eukprot:Gb_03327 [translate_table: standard]
MLGASVGRLSSGHSSPPSDTWVVMGVRAKRFGTFPHVLSFCWLPFYCDSSLSRIRPLAVRQMVRWDAPTSSLPPFYWRVAFDALDWSTYHTLRRLTPSVGLLTHKGCLLDVVCLSTLAINFHPLSLCPFVASTMKPFSSIPHHRFPPLVFSSSMGCNDGLFGWECMPGGGLFENLFQLCTSVQACPSPFDPACWATSNVTTMLSNYSLSFCQLELVLPLPFSSTGCNGALFGLEYMWGMVGSFGWDFGTGCRCDSVHLFGTSTLLSFPSLFFSDCDGGSFGRECMPSGGLFENVPGRVLASKFVTARFLFVASCGTSSSCGFVRLVLVASLARPRSFLCPPSAIAYLQAKYDIPRPRSFLCPPSVRLIVTVARLDGSACRAVGYTRMCSVVRSVPSFKSTLLPLKTLCSLDCDGGLFGRECMPGSGLFENMSGCALSSKLVDVFDPWAVESWEAVNRKDMGDVLVAISHEPKGGGMNGALSKARQLGLPKGCRILVGVMSSFSQPLMGYWAGPKLSVDVESTSLGREVPKGQIVIGPTKGRVAENGETLPVALRQEDGSIPSVPNPSGGNLQKGKRSLGETSQGEHQREAYPKNPCAVINGASLGNYPGESLAQVQMRGRGERVTTDEGTEEKAVGCGEGIRHDTKAWERTKCGNLGEGSQAKNAASAPPGGSTTAGGRVQLARPSKMGRAILDNSGASRNAASTHLLSSNTPTYSVKGKSTDLQRWDNLGRHKGFYTARGLRGESSNSATPSSLWPRRPHFNELRLGRKQDSQLDQPSEQHDLVCIWNLGHLSRQAFGVELEVCLGVLWRDVVKWARVRDSWSEGSVRFDVVVKAGKVRVVLDRLRKRKGWVAMEHRSFKEREARRERVGGGRGSQGQANWKIVSWNINGYMSKKWDLQHLARGCLRAVGQRGVALAVSKEFQSFQVGPIDPNNIWAQVSHQSLGNRAWIFGSVYIPQCLHMEEHQDCLRRVLGAVQDLESKFRGAPLVMLGDWNMSLKSLEQWIARCRGMQVLKVAGDRRSFHSAKGKPVSAIDHIVVEKPLGFQRAKINEVRDEIRFSNRWDPLERLDCSLEEGVELDVKSFVDISVSIASSVGVIGDVGARRPRSGFRVTGRIKRLIHERSRCFREVLRARRGSRQEREAVELWEESKAATKKECARESWKAFQANLEKGRNLMVLNKQKEFWNRLKSLSGKGGRD